MQRRRRDEIKRRRSEDISVADRIATGEISVAELVNAIEHRPTVAPQPVTRQAMPRARPPATPAHLSPRNRRG